MTTKLQSNIALPWDEIVRLTTEKIKQIEDGRDRLREEEIQRLLSKKRWFSKKPKYTRTEAEEIADDTNDIGLPPDHQIMWESMYDDCKRFKRLASLYKKDMELTIEDLDRITPWE